MIPFNKPYISGNELKYIEDVISSRELAGDGKYTKKCEEFFEQRFGFKKAILTTSCTDALEMAVLLMDIQPGDEVIIPSFTYVSTANVFAMHGARIVFADCKSHFPILDEESIEELITSKTKAIVPVHYSGVSCNMERIMEIALRHNIFVLEDAAMAINCHFKSSKNEVHNLGGIGHFSAFSFHDTKNVSSGEGGLLVINDDRFIERAQTIRDKGTNKKSFLNGESDKYEWVDLGSSFSPNEITAAFLYAQLEALDVIQEKRMEIWNEYQFQFNDIQYLGFELPLIPSYSESNGHVFFIICDNKNRREKLIQFMRKNGVKLSFHYNSLHKTKYYLKENKLENIPNSEKFSDCLVRFPIYPELKKEDVRYIVSIVREFFSN